MSIYDALPIVKNGLPESIFKNAAEKKSQQMHIDQEQRKLRVTFGGINDFDLSEDCSKLTITVRDGLTFIMLSGIADMIWKQDGVVVYDIENMQDYAEVNCFATVTLIVCPKNGSAVNVLNKVLKNVIDVI